MKSAEFIKGITDLMGATDEKEAPVDKPMAMVFPLQQKMEIIKKIADGGEADEIGGHTNVTKPKGCNDPNCCDPNCCGDPMDDLKRNAGLSGRLTIVKVRRDNNG